MTARVAWDTPRRHIPPERVVGVACPACGQAPALEGTLGTPYRQAILGRDLLLEPGIIWTCAGCGTRSFHADGPDRLPVILDTARGRAAKVRAARAGGA